MSEWNRRIIEEFRTNHGKVGGDFAGKPLLLLTHHGAKTGEERVNPLMFLEDGDRYVVFASKGGAPSNPDWFSNVRANPRVTVEIGDDRFEAEARVAAGPERDGLYARQAELYPQFAEYQRKTDRVIPVVILEPAR
jgi:deazaflavin-dependent oxidoreductase (nitroreductase family)